MTNKPRITTVYSNNRDPATQPKVVQTTSTGRPIPPVKKKPCKFCEETRKKVVKVVKKAATFFKG